MPNIKKMHETDKDQQHEEFISGRHQEIPVDPAKEFHRTTLAAGAVIWRGSPQDPEIALIHRPHYDDWSLPKGQGRSRRVPAYHCFPRNPGGNRL